MEFREAFVYVNSIFAGTLSEIDDGYSFKYDDEYLKIENPLPISLTMPITNKEYKSNVLFPFFDGLIPEGWLLNVVSHNWKIDQNDRFGLLMVACVDCIGNVSIKSKKL